MNFHNRHNMFCIPERFLKTDVYAEGSINIVCFMELYFSWVENWENTLNYATDLFVRAACVAAVCMCV